MILNTKRIHNSFWRNSSTRAKQMPSKILFVGKKRSALVNIRRKALLSSVGFRKRMTSLSPRGIYLTVTLVCFGFDRPLWFVWWSDGLFRGLVLLFRSSLDWVNQEHATASVWKWCFNVSPRSSLLANREGPFSGCYWVTSLEWPRMEWHSRKITQTSK